MNFKFSLPTAAALLTSLLIFANIGSIKLVAIPHAPSALIPGGLIAIPLVFILTDFIAHSHGPTAAKYLTYLSLASTLLFVAQIQLVIFFPTAIDNPTQNAFDTVLGSTPRILLASSVAYILGNLVNITLFKALKEKNGPNKFYLNTTLATCLTLVLDSFLFVFIAYLGAYSIPTLLSLFLFSSMAKVFFNLAYLGTLFLLRIKSPAP